MLRSSRIHPSLSAHASLFGNYDFNRVPLAPPGTQVVAHVAADSRTTFGQHGKVGWYIGPSPEHYRCYKCYFSDTMSERDVLTVDFFPEKIPFPRFTAEDYLKQTAEDMLHLLHSKSTSTSTTPLSFGPPILNAFAKVADILGRAIQPPLPPSAPRVSISPTPVAPPRVSIPSQPPTPPILPRRSPRLHHANSMQHDPSVAGKMFNSSTGRAETVDSLLHSPDTIIWTKSLSNEWGRLAQGLSKTCLSTDCILGNNTIFFILPSQVPSSRKVTYANFVCTMRPGKSEPCRIHMTVGGDQLDAYQDVRSPAVGITDTKLHLNSTISDAKHGARYCTGDLKDFFLAFHMKIYQYIRVHHRYLPAEVIAEYSLTPAHFDSKGYVYLEIRQGMYGLKEAAILAYDQLQEHLAPHGYAPFRFTLGL